MKTSAGVEQCYNGQTAVFVALGREGKGEVAIDADQPHNRAA